MSLDVKTVAKMARLARIGLSEEELQAHQKEMQGIIGWVDHLNEVDITDVPPMVGTGLAQPRLRDDKVTDGNCPEAVLSNAPEREGPFYTVPKVVE
ncbi:MULTISPECIES: Asp-tRNA(Asn)/Glu-tRNA(Gln) amidotransferase subunit GatC [Bombella]|uniref:Aspartyl/glutamyl-tRNA(Asn/Gln) amidotransferase subunit C n=2 Tax=Bombella TaxID=1654741 RepID=A0ABT3WNC5_9PROT|nr:MULTISPECIES: Asp-tRNA(Asn)/Glu-tRNA(Gln) amidotransferase subunit GatC [Bombella]MCT6855996.1 Asp-tRNA(Asn)/Glu-tRNA(Gln) amidotransferase subunit GatC [Bombella apis]PHI95281.1 asparaginyl/glutamyl-tRNA amidotransferase subunit C [Parasaccharibacter apium]MCX5614091.1 Asp-tRNA(Asn)/Glu-tRNA(Gln) amidotransferase subunit GatC [Bombella saccharophila]MCX5620491.1 Asp-tRNA(Asn)/Glu-tRNA(Gln) amidotransferase subunit GatC [Bombella pollinis]MUG04626.1 Asp-tRNA(Asn)/Glu-tRNA(Gln) amidotransfer